MLTLAYKKPLLIISFQQSNAKIKRLKTWAFLKTIYIGNRVSRIPSIGWMRTLDKQRWFVILILFETSISICGCFASWPKQDVAGMKLLPFANVADYRKRDEQWRRDTFSSLPG